MKKYFSNKEEIILGLRSVSTAGWTLSDKNFLKGLATFLSHGGEIKNRYPISNPCAEQSSVESERVEYLPHVWGCPKVLEVKP